LLRLANAPEHFDNFEGAAPVRPQGDWLVELALPGCDRASARYRKPERELPRGRYESASLAGLNLKSAIFERPFAEGTVDHRTALALMEHPLAAR